MPNDQENIELLIVQKLTASLSDTEDAVLTHLLSEDQSVKVLWDEFKDTHEIYTSGMFAQSLSEKDAWEKVRQHLQISPAVLVTETSPRSFFTRKRSLAFAAILAIITTFLSIYFFKNNSQKQATSYDGVVLKMANGKTINIPNGQQNITVDQNTNSSLTLTDGSVLADAQKEGLQKEEYNTLYVPAGKDYHLLLADGTEVWLNAATEFKFPMSFSGDTRTVNIKGEGFFKVSPNNKKPFIVKSNEMDVKVLGTEFNIKCYDDEPVKASLVTGKIALDANNGKATAVLIPGKEAQITSGGQFQISDFEEDVTLSWLKGVYIFNNQDLRHLQSVIRRWYDMEVVLAEDSLANKRFTGAVQKNKPVEEFLNSLTKSSGMQFHITNKQVVFKSK